MAEGQVNIVFNADTSQMTQAFAKVNGELASVSSTGTGSMKQWRTETGLASEATVNWTRLAKDHAAAQTFMAGTVGKTAADFKAATNEQRKASVATEELTQKTYSLVGAYAAYRIARAAIDVAKYVATQSIEKESSEVRFKNLAGNTQEASAAYEDLKKVSKDTGININELADAETTLREAGVPNKSLAVDMEALGKKAQVAGVPVGELADLYLRLATRGEVSGRQLALIAKLTGDETGKLAQKYQEMTILIPRLAVELERVHKIQERMRQDEETAFSRRREDENRSYSYQQRVSDIATGATGAATAAYRESGGPPPSVRTNAIKEMAKAYHISEADAEFYMAGENAGPGLIAKAAEQQRIGRAALAGQGVNVGAAIASGEITAGPLMEAGRATSERTRETGQTTETRAREDDRREFQRRYEDRLTALEVRKEQDKVDIAKQGGQALLGTTPGSADQFAKQQATQEAELRRAALEVQDAAQSAGTGLQRLSDWIDGVSKSLSGFDRAAHPVKGAQAPEPYVRNIKPGGVGYNWADYPNNTTGPVKPDTNTKPGEGIFDKLLSALDAIVGMLQGAIGG